MPQNDKSEDLRTMELGLHLGNQKKKTQEKKTRKKTHKIA